MSNGNLQDKVNRQVSDTEIKDNPLVSQALILGAYLEEQKIWEDKKVDVLLQIESLIKEMDIYKTQLLNYSKTKLTFCSWFKIKPQAQKKLDELNIQLDTLNASLRNLLDSPPDPQMYELAMLGNIFKLR